MSAPPRSASHPCLKAYVVSYSFAAPLLLNISSICQFANPAALSCQYNRRPSGFMVIPTLHGMRLSTSSYYQTGRDCISFYHRKTAPGPRVYICSAEPDKSYNNPPTHTFDPNSILALRFYYYYIASEGSVNTIYGYTLSDPWFRDGPCFTTEGLGLVLVKCDVPEVMCERVRRPIQRPPTVFCRLPAWSLHEQDRVHLGFMETSRRVHGCSDSI
jgi:hypothetical protein